MPELPAPPPPSPATPQAWLLQGQHLEAQGHVRPAAEAYDRAIALLRAADPADDEIRRQLGVAWMNRGNALKQMPGSLLSGPEAKICFADAIAAYDEALALFQTLPLAVARHRNHLGAAGVNRGHALLLSNDLTAAVAAFEQAIAHLAGLPLDENPAYRLNLAGAWTNLAHTVLSAAPARARTAALTALSLVTPAAATELPFAEMSLRARRALVTALGILLAAAEAAGQPTVAFAAEATDSIDEGLSLARGWEARTPHLRPLAARLFRLGTQLYRMHQPHFLAEFILENLDPAAPGTAFARDPDLRATAGKALLLALADLQRPQMLLAGTPESERVVGTARSLRAAQQRLADISTL